MTGGKYAQAAQFLLRCGLRKAEGKIETATSKTFSIAAGLLCGFSIATCTTASKVMFCPQFSPCCPNEQAPDRGSVGEFTLKTQQKACGPHRTLIEATNFFARLRRRNVSHDRKKSPTGRIR